MLQIYDSFVKIMPLYHFLSLIVIITTLIAIYYFIKNQNLMSFSQANLYLNKKSIIASHKQQNIKLKVQLEQQKQITRIITHEIRTSVHGICGLSQFLDQHWHDITELNRQGQVNNIHRISEQLKDFIATILDLSKFDAGKMIFNFEAVDLKQYIEEVIEHHKQLYLTIKLNIFFYNNNIGKAMIYADPLRIRQLLLNLMSNAIKYTTDGKVEVKLSLIENNSISFWKCEIIDQGIGIPKEEFKLIFEPFYQASVANKFNSSGLGLTICREIVNAHQGQIWAENNFPKGTNISFNIPIYLSASPLREYNQLYGDSFNEQKEEEI